MPEPFNDIERAQAASRAYVGAQAAGQPLPDSPYEHVNTAPQATPDAGSIMRNAGQAWDSVAARHFSGGSVNPYLPYGATSIADATARFNVDGSPAAAAPAPAAAAPASLGPVASTLPAAGPGPSTIVDGPGAGGPATMPDAGLTDRAINLGSAPVQMHKVAPQAPIVDPAQPVPQMAPTAPAAPATMGGQPDGDPSQLMTMLSPLLKMLQGGGAGQGGALTPQLAALMQSPLWQMIMRQMQGQSQPQVQA